MPISRDGFVRFTPMGFGFFRRRWANLLCALLLLSPLILAGCGGSDAETASRSGPGANRYFGDHPGQRATNASIGRGDCEKLRRAVETEESAGATKQESEPSPPSSRCVIADHGLRVGVYLDAAYAARQRYYNRIVEQVQFNAPDPARIPHAVPGVGDRSAGEHTASWIPSYSTLYAVRGNRWLTVAYSAPGIPRAKRKARAAVLAREAFRLTAR